MKRNSVDSVARTKNSWMKHVVPSPCGWTVELNWEQLLASMECYILTVANCSSSLGHQHDAATWPAQEHLPFSLLHPSKTQTIRLFQRVAHSGAFLMWNGTNPLWWSSNNTQLLADRTMVLKNKIFDATKIPQPAGHPEPAGGARICGR